MNAGTAQPIIAYHEDESDVCKQGKPDFPVGTFRYEHNGAFATVIGQLTRLIITAETRLCKIVNSGMSFQVVLDKARVMQRDSQVLVVVRQTHDRHGDRQDLIHTDTDCDPLERGD